MTTNTQIGIAAGSIIGLIGFAVVGYISHKSRKRLRRVESLVDNMEDERSRMKAVLNKLDASIDEAAKNVDIHVDDYIVSEAIDKAVTDTVNTTVNREVGKVCAGIRNDAHSEIKKHADKVSADIRKSLEESISAQASADVMRQIDIYGVRDEIVKKGTELFMDKLSSTLDDIATRYKTSLDDAGKIYKKIAEKFD